VWLDRRKRRSVTFKVDEIEYQIIQDIAEALDVPLGEAIRRAIWVFRILYDKDLTVRDALLDTFDPDGPLYKALKPIPELSYALGLELNLWRRQQSEKLKRTNSV